MQTCIECGWDTRSGSRICSACRTTRPDAGGSDATPATSDPSSEKEALLTAVLRSARAPEPAADERPRTDDESTPGVAARTDDHGSYAALGPGEHDDGRPSIHPGTGDRDDVIALRELGAGDNEIDLTGDSPRVHHTDPPPVADHTDPPPLADDRPGPTVTDQPVQRQRSQFDDGSGQATGFTDRSGQATGFADRSGEATGFADRSGEATGFADRSGEAPGFADDDTVPPATAPGRGDTADDLAALFDTPSPWDDDTTDDPSVPPATRTPSPNGRTGNDTADDLAALFNTPSPWDDDSTPPGEHDTGDDLVALFNRPGPWDRAPAPSDEPDGSGTQDRHDTIPPATREHITGDDLAGTFGPSGTWDREAAPPSDESWATGERQLDAPAPYPASEPATPPRDDALEDTARFSPLSDDAAGTDAPADADYSTDSWEAENRNTKYLPEEWPWVTKTGDAGVWAPPPSGSHYTDQARQTHDVGGVAHDDADSGPISGPISAPTSGPISGPIGRPGTPDAATSSPPAHAPAAAEPEAVSGIQRWFRDLGGWTAIAQVALLAVGMLCIIQVFVLIVVTSYLNDGGGPSGDTAGSLAAHAKVDGVMLPALLAFATLALVFAAWRAFDSSSDDGFLRRPLGFPIGLWGVLLSVLVLLAVVVMPAAPEDVDAARQITQLAMAACSLLGVACFVAPRGLEDLYDDET